MAAFGKSVAASKLFLVGLMLMMLSQGLFYLVQLLMIDEASMVDDLFWASIARILENIQMKKDGSLRGAPDKLGQAGSRALG